MRWVGWGVSDGNAQMGITWRRIAWRRMQRDAVPGGSWVCAENGVIVGLGSVGSGGGEIGLGWDQVGSGGVEVGSGGL